MTISWVPEKMSTGVRSVDVEHQEWVRRFNEFEAAIAAGAGIDSVEKMLEFMAAYSEKHFAHEEKLMEGMDTPEAQLNRIEHEKFRETIKDLRFWVKRGDITSAEIDTLQTDLEKWLDHHICEVDINVWKTPDNPKDPSAK